MTNFTMIMEATMPATKRTRAGSPSAIVRPRGASAVNGLWFGDAYTHAQAQGTRPRGPAPA